MSKKRIAIVLIIAAASSRSYTFDGYGEKIVLSSGGSVVAGILVIVFGSLFSWIGSFSERRCPRICLPSAFVQLFFVMI